MSARLGTFSELAFSPNCALIIFFTVDLGPVLALLGLS